MKKIKLLLMFVFITTMAFGQIDDESNNPKPKSEFSIYSVSMGGGVSYFPIDTKDASNVGFNIMFTINKIYCDISSNGASGDGEELDFSSSYTRPANKLNVGVFNVGYIISVKKVSIIPMVGYGWSNEIYQDPIGWDTYYYGKATGHFNIGVAGNVQLSKMVGLYVGVGNYERFKAGLSFQLMN